MDFSEGGEILRGGGLEGGVGREGLEGGQAAVLNERLVYLSRCGLFIVCRDDSKSRFC